MHKAIHMTIRREHPTHGQLFFFLLIFALATHLVLITGSVYSSSDYT